LTSTLQVGVSFSKDSAQPGDNISITAKADADTPVLVGVIDTSLTLLADACKSLESSNVSYICTHILSFNTVMYRFVKGLSH